MDEADDFRPVHAHRMGLPDAEDVNLRLNGDRLRVLLTASPWGSPRRNRRPPAVMLGRAQWLRWHINYRFSGCQCGAEWSYRLDTLSIAHGVGSPDLFMGDPDHLVDERAHLR